MKKNIVYLLAILILSSVAFSCNREEDDIWKGNYQERLAEYLESCSAILKAAPAGWHMIYYAGDGPGNMVGAMNYHLTFLDDKVTASADFDTDNHPAGTAVESLYKLKTDGGPTLSFDTYNEIVHYFTEYKGSSFTYRGDFEFIFEKVSQDEIILRGKRFDGYIIMRPWDKGAPSEYLVNVNRFINSTAYPNYKLVAAGEEERTATFDIDTRRFSTTMGGDAVSYSLLFDLEGFYISKVGAGSSLETVIDPDDYFKWNPDTEEFTGEIGGKNIRLVRTIPEGYIPYDDYPGTYTFQYRETNTGTVYSKTITLTEGIKNRTFRVSQNATGYEFSINYLWSNGGLLEILPQFIEEHIVGGTAYHLWLLPYDATNGYMTYTRSIGLISETISTAPLTYTFKDNGEWGSYVANGLYLRYLDVTDTSYEGFLASAYRYVLMNFTKQ